MSSGAGGGEGDERDVKGERGSGEKIFGSQAASPVSYGFRKRGTRRTHEQKGMVAQPLRTESCRT
jgi:hypothetical protein